MVEASGTKGDDATIWFPRTPETGRVGRYIASVLESLGYRVHVQAPFNDEGKYFLALPPSPQIASMGWLANYPTAEEFIKPLLTCGGAANLGHFCDRRIDRKTDHALDVQSAIPTGREPAVVAARSRDHGQGGAASALQRVRP